MKFTDLTVLLPCHSLDDFPVYHEGPQADELLSAWCAPWHPALIASAQTVPTYHRLDVPPEEVGGRLLVLPPFCTDQLPAGFVARAKNEGAWLVRKARREQAVAAALEGLDGGDGGVEPELAADFLALGFCRLQVELLTRHMRYSTNIDDAQFRNEAVAAAQAAIERQPDQAREHLARCYDVLYEARKHVYPVDVCLLDITLLAPATLGAALEKQLTEETAANYLTAVELLEELAANRTDIWRKLLEAIDRGAACVLGDERVERELPLLPLEAARNSLLAGVERYEALLGRRPQVYARRRAGLCSMLPAWLTKSGFLGALHFTLDDGRFPLGPQCKTRWEGLDGSVIDIYARVPLDAAKNESFLGLSRKIADSMDTDHVATVAFAHWPGGGTPWYDDLRRIARHSPVLGKFMLLDDYFSHTDMPGRISKFEPDEYRTPYLKQAIIRRTADPISQFARQHQQQSEVAAVQAIELLGELTAPASPVPRMTDVGTVPLELDKPLGLETTVDLKLPNTTADLPAVDLTQAVSRLATALAAGTSSAATGTGFLVANPLSSARRVGIELPGSAAAPAIQAPVVAAGTAAGRTYAVVDVPSLGFAWIPSAAAASSPRAKPIADDNVLRNEFFEVAISLESGGIKALYNFKQRGNRLSQQVAFRLPPLAPETGISWVDPDAAARYTTMRAERVETTVACPALGEIVSQGLLLDEEESQVARFQQTTRLWAGCRVLEVEIELSELAEPRADPWNSYYAARFAWADAAVDLWRGVGLTRQPTEIGRLEAPEFIELEAAASRITLLTGGLPYHRRSGDKTLDSLLIVRGETARSFRLGIGVDVPNSATAAIDFLTPACAVPTGMKPQAASGWFFHLDAKNIVATHWQVLYGEAEPGASTRRVRGFRARLLETAGRSGRVTLRAMRPVAAARQVDFLGQTMLDLRVDGDQVALDFAHFEWIDVEAIFAT